MAGLPVASQWPRSLRVCLEIVLIGLFWAVAGTAQAAAEGFEVGWRWQYRHEGPRPGNVEPNAIDGQRILHVTSVVDAPEGKQWVIEERYTNDTRVVGRLYVNQERMLTSLELVNEKGEAAKLRYDPPVPYLAMDLNVGQERKIETALRMDSADFSLPSAIAVRRLEDETITTPAGEFAGCLHYLTTTISTLNIKIAKIPVTEEREQWYHRSANGVVKEVYRKGPVKFLTWSRAGYTATSVLTAFGKEEVKVAVEPVTEPNAGDHRRDEQHEPQPQTAPSGRKTGVALLGAITMLMVAGVIWVGLCGRCRRDA